MRETEVGRQSVIGLLIVRWYNFAIMPELLSTQHELVETLRRVNPILNPIELGDVFPSYKPYIPHRKGFGLWSTSESLLRVITSYMQQDNVILEISGIAAGGKDAIRETIERLTPGLLSKAITATSRDPRKGERHGVDYYFYDGAHDFKSAIERREFVEWVQQGERLYGLPKVSLHDAMTRDEPVMVTHIEMESGWPAIDKVVASKELGKRVMPLKVFVLPNMSFSDYADSWLPERRADVDTRLLRAAWEISVAADNADFIVVNTVASDLTALEWESQAVANHCMMLLKGEQASRFKLFDVPFQISPGIGGRQPVVDYHQQLVV